LLLSLTGRATPRLEDRIGVLSRWSFPHQINRGKSINSTSDIDKQTASSFGFFDVQ
jgi:hypothetical protein